MSQTRTNFDNALKDLYGPAMENGINNSTPLLSQMSLGTAEFTGRQYVWSVHSGRSSATGSRHEAGTLPTADRQRTLQPKLTIASHYHTVKITNQALESARSNIGSFSTAMEIEMEGAVQDIAFDQGRQGYNHTATINSVTEQGAIATVNDASPSTTLPLDFEGAALDESSMRYFFVGMLLDFVNASSGAVVKTSAEVTAIDVDNRTITVDDVTAVVDNAVIFRAGNYTAAAGSAEMHGLPIIIGTGDFAGITAASNPVWNGLTSGSSTTQISEIVLDTAQEEVELNGNAIGIRPTLTVMNNKQARKLKQLLAAKKLPFGETTELKGGFSGVQLAGQTVLTDRLCPVTSVFTITTRDLRKFVMSPWHWNTDGGKTLSRALDGSDAVEGRYQAYHDIGAVVRNSHVITTVAAPTF